MKIKNSELITIQGGGWLNGTFLNALSRAASLMIEIGRMFGSSVRRMIDRNYCSNN